MLPPIPPWDGVHPLVVHRPIALLLIVPLFVLAAAVLRRGRAGAATALTLMVLGLGAAFATASGEAAGELADRSVPVAALLERHEHAAERVRNLFSVLTLAYVGLLLLLPPGEGGAAPKLSPTVTRAAQVVFLGLYLPVALMLVNAAHDGGRLVHQHGVHALLNQDPQPPAAADPRMDDD